tara:strand:+ start:315 stop:512 length:198 start_codon:yes stop_codon:yes gene_type:complete
MKLYETDYILVNSKTKKPIESLDVIYHYTSVVELLNETMIKKNIEYMSMSELPKKIKDVYIKGGK